MKRALLAAGGLVLAIAAIVWLMQPAKPAGGERPATREKSGPALRWTGGPAREESVEPEFGVLRTVRGRVLDAIEGHAIEGAIVTLRLRSGEELESSVSDEEGAFEFEDAGEATVVAASADGYAIRAKALASEPGEIVLELDGAVTVSGSVHDPHGAPVADAEVWVEDYERMWQEPPAVSTSVRSGADGAFSIPDAPSGTLIAHAAHARFAMSFVRIGGVGPGRSKSGVRITLGDTGVLFGRVLDVSGKPVEGATLTWFPAGRERWSGPEAVASAVSGPDGAYRFAHLPAGEGAVRASDESGEGASPAAIAAGEEEEADVTLVRESIFAGVVVDGNGRPVEGARVWIPNDAVRRDILANEEDSHEPELLLWTARRARQWVRDPAVASWGTVTGADGSFRFHAPVRGEVPLHARKLSAQGETRTGPGEAIEIQVSGLGVARITLTGADGKPFLDYARVIATTMRNGKLAGDQVTLDDRRGEGTMELEPGTWSFNVARKGGPHGEIMDADGETALRDRKDDPPGTIVEIAPAPPETLVALRVSVASEPRARVRGRVVGPDGAAVAGARVSLATAGQRDWGGARGERLDWSATARTDANGRFALEASPGERRLFVYHPELRAEVVAVTVPERGEADARVIRMTAGEGVSAIFEFTGIGAVLAVDEQARCVVRDVVKDGPAERAGIRKGDLIREVDGVLLHGMGLGDVIERIRGPIGTTVRIVIDREGNLEPIVFDVVRDKIRA